MKQFFLKKEVCRYSAIRICFNASGPDQKRGRSQERDFSHSFFMPLDTLDKSNGPRFADELIDLFRLPRGQREKERG